MQNEKRKDTEPQSIEQTLYYIGFSLAGVAFIAAVLCKRFFRGSVFDLLMPCVFHKITGLYCPSCGGTRAVRALLDGRLLLSFRYYPPVLYVAALYLWFMISHTIERLTKGRYKIGMKYKSRYLWILLFLILGNLLVKNGAILLFGIDLLSEYP